MGAVLFQCCDMHPFGTNVSLQNLAICSSLDSLEAAPLKTLGPRPLQANTAFGSVMCQTFGTGQWFLVGLLISCGRQCTTWLVIWACQLVLLKIRSNQFLGLPCQHARLGSRRKTWLSCLKVFADMTSARTLDNSRRFVRHTCGKAQSHPSGRSPDMLVQLSSLSSMPCCHLKASHIQS
jgi:hypothetical protein